ncbi:MAG: DUF6514 family protein [Clostridiales bacterium]|nr:DUF6514 family protein [Clostridiales bacterium]
MYLYIPVKQQLFNSVIGNYVSYGIECVEVKSEQAERVAFVSDVSVDFRFVTDLALKCTLGQLSPYHLMDVIEDEL